MQVPDTVVKIREREREREKKKTTKKNTNTQQGKKKKKKKKRKEKYSRLGISNSKGFTEILRDIRTSTYQSWESEENNKLNNHI